ncbi:MAG: J domain-containing protein [Spirochaetales bacterium]|nr:J domain-containing protein [Spirochaetales bacterium]
MQRINIKNHIFKLTGAAAGLVTGLGVFGLIFGFIAGAFIDQLTAGIRQKRQLKSFIISPTGAPEGSPLFTGAAALITGWYFSRGDSAKRTLFSSAAILYFPEAPACCLEILSDMAQDGLNADTMGAARYFGMNAEDEQKNHLAGLLRVCGLAQGSFGNEDENLLEAAGIDSLFENSEGHSRAEDYAVLGLKPGAPEKEVKRVYHRLASQFHPDGNSQLSSQQQRITKDAFIRIKEAYERLIRQVS